MNQITAKTALEELRKEETPFLKVFSHSTLEVEIYKPDLVDHQQPHIRDEVYIINEGSGKFTHNNQMTHVSKGDFLFVPAGDEHRFSDFTDDFSTWVLFYGPEGGE